MILKLIYSLALLTFINSAMAYGNDIEVYYSNGDVIVIGDSAANDIEIRRLYSSIHQFRGLNGTTINGSSQALTLPIQDDLKIWMLGGDDFVDIRSVYLRSTTHADLIIEMGRDDDELKVKNANVRRDIVVSDDFVFRGDDKITVNSCRARNIDVETQGSSLIGVVYNDCNWIRIESGLGGDDFISVAGNDATTIDIDASNEDDELIFVGNSVHGFLHIYLNAGDDSLQFSINDMFGVIGTIDGGIGRDIGSGLPWSYNAAMLGFGRLSVPNFE